MPLYRDEGVVLRTAKLGEADRIVTLLTRSHGKIRAGGEGRAPCEITVRRSAGAFHAS